MKRRPEKIRFTCSIAAWWLPTSTSLVALQFGQSAHPSPEFVSRTIAPLTMIATSNTTLTRARRASVRGKTRGRAHRSQVYGATQLRS